MASRNRGWPFLVLLLFLALPFLAFGQDATVQSTVFPEAILADGASTVTLSVQVRNRNGSNVPDGTQVLFETSLGTLRENLVTTKNGFAQTVLTSGSISGTARVSITVLAFRASGSVDVRFAASRDELETELFAAELSAPNRLTYSPERRILRADGPGQLVRFKAPGIELRADDFQYDILSNRVTAKRAWVKFEGREAEYAELWLDIRSKQGVALASREAVVPRFRPSGRLFAIDFERRARVAPLAVTAISDVPLDRPLLENEFKFTAIDEDVTLVYAKQATIYPAREVQFRKASVDVQGAMVMRGVPIFRVSTQSVQPVLTEEYLRLANNSLNVDFPYYLNLSAGSSSAFRFRYGTLYSRGVGAAGGMYLDFEQNWSLGGDQRGFLAFQGLGRKDWGITARQALSLWRGANAFLSADFPGNRTLVGSLSADSRVGRQFRATYNFGATRTVRGDSFRSMDQSFTLRRDPQRLGKSPFSMNFGLSAASREFQSTEVRTSTEFVGADIQLLLSSLRVGKGNLSSSARVSHVTGRNVRVGLTSGITTTFSAPLGSSSTLALTYDFSDDRFSSRTIGKHRLNAEVNLDLGRAYLYTFLSKSLDVDRINVQSDLSYRFSQRWRLGATGTLESFRGSSFSDVGVVVAYNLGLREIGLSWSQRRNRIGLEILGTPIR